MDNQLYKSEMSSVMDVHVYIIYDKDIQQYTMM